MRTAAAVLLSLPLFAQQDLQLTLAREAVDKAFASSSNGSVADGARPDAVTGASLLDGLVAVWLLQRQTSQQELLAWMGTRSDMQLGANPTLLQTSSAALRPGAPRVLSLAVDMGMLGQTTNGQLVTFRGTPAGIVEALAGWKLLHRPWDRLSMAATFDRSRDVGADANSFRQLASWSAALEVLNRRKPRSSDWVELASSAGTYRRASEALLAAFAEWPELRQWQARLADRWEVEVDRPVERGWVEWSSARSTAENIARDEFERMASLAIPQPVAAVLDQYARELGTLLKARGQLRTRPRTGPIVAIDFTSLRPVQAKAEWISTLVAQTTLSQDTGIDAALNVSYRSNGAAQAAGELIIPACTGTASLSVRAVRLSVDRNRWEGSAQASWFVPLADGIRLPLSVGVVRDPMSGHLHTRLSVGLQWTTDSAVLGR